MTIDEEIEKTEREEWKSELERKLRETFTPQSAQVVNNATVTIPLSDYERLIIVADRYNKLINVLMRYASLSYSGGELYFDNSTVGDAMRILEGDLYFDLLEKLKETNRKEKGEK